MIFDEEKIKKIDNFIGFFSECFYTQFGIYPKVQYDVTGVQKNVYTIDDFREVVNRAIENNHPNRYFAGISTKRRDRVLVLYRQYYFYLSRTRTTFTLEEVGKKLGNFDHATVSHGVDMITKLKEIKDPQTLSIIKNVDIELLRYSRETGKSFN